MGQILTGLNWLFTNYVFTNNQYSVIKVKNTYQDFPHFFPTFFKDLWNRLASSRRGKTHGLMAEVSSFQAVFHSVSQHILYWLTLTTNFEFQFCRITPLGMTKRPTFYIRNKDVFINLASWEILEESVKKPDSRSFNVS